MKKLVLITVLCCLFAGAVAARQNTASQFEGRWVWNGTKEHFITEIVFSGDVILFYNSDEKIFVGFRFTYTDQFINIFQYGDIISLAYNLSGGLLILDYFYEDEWLTYIRSPQTIPSPLEGLWKIENITSSEPLLAEHWKEVSYFLFIQDTMMLYHSKEGMYAGIRVRFDCETIFPVYEEYEDYLTFNFRVQGNMLILNDKDGVRIELLKTYSVIP